MINQSDSTFTSAPTTRTTSRATSFSPSQSFETETYEKPHATFNIPISNESSSGRSRSSTDPLKPVALQRSNRSLSERKLYTPTADKLVLVMVGLPARGKSFIAKKLCKFLSWKGIKTNVFNVGQLRRKLLQGTKQDHTFFDAQNKNASEERERLAKLALEEIQQWFLGEITMNEHGELIRTPGGEVAIFDATNTTRSRRKILMDTFRDFARTHAMSVHVVFIESICTNEQVIHANIMQKVTCSPDYANVPIDQAIADLMLRMKNYEAVYEALEDDETISYIKLFDLQSKVHAKGIYGHVAKSILPYMMSIHIDHNPVWLVRAGHCTDIQDDFRQYPRAPLNVSRSARLSELGIEFAKSLAAFVQERKDTFEDYNETHELLDENFGMSSSPHTQFYMQRHGHEDPLLVLTSTLPRAVETAQFLPLHCQIQAATLNPLDKGECYGINTEQMRQQMPEAWAAYQKDPFKTRFPGGESYFDLMLRLEPILIDIEQHTGPVLVVSHISTLQVLFSYFLGVPIEKCRELEIPFHSIVELAPHQDGWEKKVFNLAT